MKRLSLILAGLCALFAFASCKKEAEKVCPVSDIKVVTPATIGDFLTVNGNGFDANATIALRPESGSEVALTTVEKTATSLVAQLPTSLQPGAHTVILSQDGIWEIGSVLLQAAQNPLTDVVISGLILIGQNLEIVCNGFPANAKIFLKSGDTKVELATTVTEYGVSCAVPATVVAGSYDVVLQLNLNEWVLAQNVPALVYKEIKSMKIAQIIDLDFDDSVSEETREMITGMYEAWGALGTISEEELAFVYDEKGMVSKLTTNDGTDWITFTNNADETIDVAFSVASNDIFNDIVYCKWTLDETGKIVGDICNYGNKDFEFTWTYNDAFQHTATMKGENVYSSLGYDENGNLNYLEATDRMENIASYDLENKLNPFSIDLVKALMVFNLNAIEPEVALANLVGLSGIGSKNVPTALNIYSGNEIVAFPITTTIDNDGYCTYLKSVVLSEGIMEGVNAVISGEFTFTY